MRSSSRHKLNEIKKVADTVTDHPRRQDDRDDRRRATTSPRTASSSGMVGRDLDHRYPDHTPHIGEELLRDRGLDGAPPAWTATASRRRRRQPQRARAARSSASPGLMGAGRTELAMSVFGRSYGASITGTVFKRGKEIKTRTVAEAIEQRHRLRHRGPQALRPQPDRGHQAQHLDGVAGQAGEAAAVVDDNEEYEVAERVPRAA